MSNAFERLNNIAFMKGPLIAGLDPCISKIEELFFSREKMEGGEDIFNYQKRILSMFGDMYITNLKNFVGAIKINPAFYEALKMQSLMFDTAWNAKSNDMFVIADVKRGDTGKTAIELAKTYLDVYSPIDAITINPYFGLDGVKPFVDYAVKNGKGVIVVVKTPNKSADDFQNLRVEDGRKLYEVVADKVEEWGERYRNENEQFGSIAAMIGTSDPYEAQSLRERLQHTFIIVPGINDPADIRNYVFSDGSGAMACSSSPIMYAKKDERYSSYAAEEAMKKAARELQDELKINIKM